jgi:biotin synthase-like enzyme
MKQPEALRLADALEIAEISYTSMVNAAYEMRRLHEANQAMLEALRPFANYACDEPCSCHNCAARTAIAKAETNEGTA